MNIAFDKRITALSVRDVNEPSQARFWLEPARKFAGSNSARLENLPARFWLGLEMARARLGSKMISEKF